MIPYIPILLGTARVDRQSEKVATYLADMLKDHKDARFELHDVRDYALHHTIPDWQPQEKELQKTEKWRDVVEKSHAFIIVTPEYNHGYPGELKMLLDQTLKPYLGKPVLTVGVSAGRFGGARVVEHLLSVYSELGLVHVPYPLYVGNVKEVFEKESSAIDEEWKPRIDKSIGKLLIYEKRLREIGSELDNDK